MISATHFLRITELVGGSHTLQEPNLDQIFLGSTVKHWCILVSLSLNQTVNRETRCGSFGQSCQTVPACPGAVVKLPSSAVNGAFRFISFIQFSRFLEGFGERHCLVLFRHRSMPHLPMALSWQLTMATSNSTTELAISPQLFGSFDSQSYV